MVTTFCSLALIINAAGAHASADVAGMTVILDSGHNRVDDAYSAAGAQRRGTNECKTGDRDQSRLFGTHLQIAMWCCTSAMQSTKWACVGNCHGIATTASARALINAPRWRMRCTRM